MKRLLNSLAVLLAVASVASGAEFYTVPQPEYQGTRFNVDLPAALHMRNVGSQVDGFGLCVPTSLEVAFARWQNDSALSGYRAWCERRPGGSYPDKTANDIREFCRLTGRPEPLYIQHTGGDSEFLALALKTRRAVGMTYAGADNFYGGAIAHMVTGAHYDPKGDWAAVIDNNRPGNWVVMRPKTLEHRWKGEDDNGNDLTVRDRFGRRFAVGGGWVVVNLAPPPPPVPVAAPWNAEFQVGQCPGGRCPAPVLRLAPTPALPYPDRDGWVPVEFADGSKGTKKYDKGRFLGLLDDAGWHPAVGPDSWEAVAQAAPADAPGGPRMVGDDCPTGVDATRVGKAGKFTYTVNGTHDLDRNGAFTLVGNVGALTDDSGKSHLTVVIPVGGEDGKAQKKALTVAVLSDARFKPYAGRVHFQVYTADDTIVKGRVSSAVTLQDPADKKGRVIATGDAIDLDTIFRVLKALDAATKPDPKPDDPAKPDGPADPKVDWSLTVLISLALAALLRWVNSLSPKKETK